MRGPNMLARVVIAAASVALAAPAAAQGAAAAPGVPTGGLLASPAKSGGAHPRNGGPGSGHRRAEARSAFAHGRDAVAIGASGRTEIDSIDSTALGRLGVTTPGAVDWGRPGGFRSPFPGGPARRMASPFPAGPNAPGPWSGR